MMKEFLVVLDLKKRYAVDEETHGVINSLGYRSGVVLKIQKK